MKKSTLKKTNSKQIGPFVSIRQFLIHGLPDFCWQDSMEVLTYAEQFDEDINSLSLIIQLWRYGRDGLIDRKLDTKTKRGPRGHVFMYKRRVG